MQRFSPAVFSTPYLVREVPEKYGGIKDPYVRVGLSPPAVEEDSYTHTLANNTVCMQ